MKKLTLSIVSHGHLPYVRRLLADLAALLRRDIEVILTLNLPETLGFEPGAWPFALKVIENAAPKGFAANHNFAFAQSQGEIFVILNPDIRITDDPFPVLLKLLNQQQKRVVAPLIVNADGAIEDSARNFPSPLSLFKKAAGKVLKVAPRGDTLKACDDLLMPDWIAGMFIAVPRELYRQLGGLSENYFLYYEDVDFCARARLAGCEILVSRQAKVIHEAQRDSHHKVRYLLWHLQSAARFFTSGAYLKINIRRLLGPL